MGNRINWKKKCNKQIVEYPESLGTGGTAALRCIVGALPHLTDVHSERLPCLWDRARLRETVGSETWAQPSRTDIPAE